MKKSDLNLTKLPETFKEDQGNLVKSKYYELGVFSWTAENEQDDDFMMEEYCLGYFSNFLAAADCSDMPLWFKVDTDELCKFLKNIDDNKDCKIIFTLWTDDCRVEEYCVKPVAHNSKWTYLKKSEEPVFTDPE